MLRLVDDQKGEIDVYSAEGFRLLSELWTKAAVQNRVMYEPSWLGIPIIQFPEDIIMMQELIWRLRPDVIVETGVAHGGSALFHASMMELMGHGRVVAIDVSIRQYNQTAISAHHMAGRVELIVGSSIDPAVVSQVKERIAPGERVLVVLDSNHSRQHVQEEMAAYGPLVEPGSYMVVMDGAQKLVADIPRGRPEWAEDNPLDAIHAFLADNADWAIDERYTRLHVTSNPCGFLQRLPKV